MESFIDKSIPYIKKWGFSVLLFPFLWILLEQFWVALGKNIMFALDYPYPFFMWPIMFVIDNVTLIIHEAGHTIFGFFGWRFLTILGGTLLQILIPFLIFTSAWWNKQISLAQFALFWTGFAWLDSAAYCADAQQLKLPLIGGLPKSAHDYMNMLTQLDLITYSMQIAWLMYGIGALCFIGALLWPLTKRPELERIHLDLKL